MQKLFEGFRRSLNEQVDLFDDEGKIDEDELNKLTARAAAGDKEAAKQLYNAADNIKAQGYNFSGDDGTPMNKDAIAKAYGLDIGNQSTSFEDKANQIQKDFEKNMQAIDNQFQDFMAKMQQKIDQQQDQRRLKKQEEINRLNSEAVESQKDAAAAQDAFYKAILDSYDEAAASNRESKQREIEIIKQIKAEYNEDLNKTLDVRKQMDRTTLDGAQTNWITVKSLAFLGKRYINYLNRVLAIYNKERQA